MKAEKGKDQGRRRWWSDPFARDEVTAQLGCIWFLVLTILATLVVHVLRPSGSKAPSVVVYAAQDQVYAEPILKDFEQATGIKVRAVYDSEAVKTVGLANRLLAERRRPQCDVFWGNEELRTRQLAAQNVFRETNGWAAFGYRSRRVAVRGAAVAPPASLLALTNPVWRGKVSLAYPLFGTTATHFLALRQHWGAGPWEAWCRGLAANQPFLEEGNSLVVKRLTRGEAWVGLTDSDDLAAAQREKLEVGQTLPMNQETLLIPNTVAVIRGAPRPEAAQRLFEYLQSREVVERLVAAQALEGASADALTTPTLKPDWDALLRDLEASTARLQAVFLRD
jgi:iron(III) transport system substrate-binding protein